MNKNELKIMTKRFFFISKRQQTDQLIHSIPSFPSPSLCHSQMGIQLIKIFITLLLERLLAHTTFELLDEILLRIQ